MEKSHIFHQSKDIDQRLVAYIFQSANDNDW